MIWKACLVLCLGLTVSCYGPAISEQKVTRHYSGHHGHLSHIGEHTPEHHETYAWAYPAYEFSYSVNDPHTHDNKGQEEHRDGDKVTGMYWLMQPNGLKRIVKYWSDHKDGFHADVEYVHAGGIHHEVPVHGYEGHGHPVLSHKGHDDHKQYGHDDHKQYGQDDYKQYGHDDYKQYGHDDYKQHGHDDRHDHHDDDRRGYRPIHGHRVPYYGHRIH